MPTFIRLLIFYILFLTTSVFGDTDKTYIHISNASADESSGKMIFTVTIDALPLSMSSPVRVGFETIDGTAKVSENDYVAKDSADVLTPAIWFFKNSDSKSKTIEIDILDDDIYEGDEYFYLKINTSSNGYAVAGTGKGKGTIIDNEIDKSVTVNVDCSGADEGDIGDTNSISCRIFLDKPLPEGEPNISIHYETGDGQYYIATPNVDYTPVSGDVLFTTGDEEKIIQIPIIGDTELEHDEELKLVISGSPDIDNNEDIVQIWDDDGDFPDISFENSSLSIIEGNSSQKFLEANITFDKPALAGSYFTYGTWDETAEDESGDNDYIETQKDVNLTGGETYVTIKIPINGDTKIEKDEVFHIGFWDLYKLDWGGANEQLDVTILNDDGSFPSMSVDQDTFSIDEGDSGQKSLNFTFTLDKPALANSSFDYYTEHINTEVDDYVENNGTYTFNGGETHITIPVTINGDTDEEADETFYLKFNNEKDLAITGTQSPIGKIINDDIEKKPFKCEERSYLFTSNQSADYSDVYFLNLGTGEAHKEKRFGTSHINATGYNVQDNYIYGFEYGNDDSNDPTNSYYIVQIDNEFNRKRIDIAGLPKTRFYLGDVSMDGIFYIANRHQPSTSSDTLQEIQRVDLNNSTLLSKITLHYDASTKKIRTSDFAFNPKDNKLYMVNAYNNQLVRVDPISGVVKELGYVGDIGDTYSVISFFDVDGNFYFYTSGSEKIYKIDISNPSSVDATATEFNDMAGLINSGDGARCANAPVTPPEVEGPFVCDSSMYISSSIKRGSGETGKMWLHKIDTTKNPFAFDVVDDAGESRLYNALAYADSGDVNATKNYIFGLYHKELVKLTRIGTVVSLGEVAGLPDMLATENGNKQFFAGAIYGDYYYVSGPGQDYDKIFKIRLSDKTVSEIALDKAISLLDFSFTPDGKYLHGIVDGGKLVKIDVATGVVTEIGSEHTGYQFDSTFSDKNGRFFANDSKGNGFFEFNLNTGDKLFLSASQKADFNDGANCLKAALVFNDYGDAPSTYGSPRHNIANGIYMGSEVDHDINPFNTIDANGDDIDGVDDEDGVTFVNGDDINGSYFDVNGTQELNVTVSKDGYLNVWLDFGIDGTFATAGDHIIVAQHLTAGSHIISFNIPSTVTKNQLTYIRFRYSSTANLDFKESVSDGEVEDYAIKFGSAFQGVKGRFNIQRTNSALNAKDFALYTQIVGRDFNYHVVFYDENLTNEEQLVKVPVKIDLIDVNNPNKPLYTEYYYFSHENPSSRILVLDGSDLNSLPATKEALFQITYAVDAHGSIVQQQCGADYQACFESLMASSDANRTDDAKDEFSIRPESFYITLADGNKERINSRNPINKILRVASGYEYNLSMIATKYGGVEPSEGYNRDFNASFDFNSTALTCANTDPIEQNINYIDGIANISNFKHNNVGEYRLTQVTDENWTAIDKANGDCIVNSSITSSDGNSKSGCNIALQTHPIDLEFYPDHFAVDLNLKNLPSSSHPDFIYMMELNAVNNNVAIAFDGNITAQSEDNTTTTNFTDGCVATNLLLDLNATTVSVEGVDQDIHTVNGTDINFSRIIYFNRDSTTPTVELNQTLTRIGKTVTITHDKFLNENNGTVTLDMRYNLNKHLTEPINPVQVTFNSIEVSSGEANSTAHDKVNVVSNMHIPSGFKTFPNSVKNFYFARVVSDFDSYPRVNMNVSPIVRTPLNVDIYCKTNIANYCSNRGVIGNSNVTATTREAYGWYLSAEHNATVDGNVTNLTANPPIVTITPDSDPSPTVNEIVLSNGQNGLVVEKFLNCSTPSSTITIETSPCLVFEPSEYVVNCTDINASQWTGVGETGHILEVKPKVNPSRKMEW